MYTTLIYVHCVLLLLLLLLGSLLDDVQAARPSNGWLWVHLDLQIHPVGGLAEDSENRCVAVDLPCK